MLKMFILFYLYFPFFNVSIMCNYCWLFMFMRYEGMCTENKENKKR